MAVFSVRFVFAVVCLIASYAEAQQLAQADTFAQQNISRTCFGCICEAASGCDLATGCNGDVCGPFRITWGYWADGGKPTLNSESTDAAGAWTRCVNEPFCAARAVQGYMNRYAQDCNNDGVINCDDYVRIHAFGGNGCYNTLNPNQENRYRPCIAKYGN